VAAGADGALWALTLEPAGGLVWQRTDTGEWRLAARAEGGLPQELEILAGRPFLGGHASAGPGALWGAVGPLVPAREDAAPAPLPQPARPDDGDWLALEARARAALADPEAYRNSAREARAALHALARSDAPPDAFERLLAGPFPDASAPFLQGAIPIPTRLLGPWLALWATTVAGRGHVPPSLLAQPWPEQPVGRAEKHFETVLAALEAIAWTGQSDPATIDALVARLDRPGDPSFLRGDVVGTLTAVTGQRHGNDVAAWRRWWSQARE
jgi:hypothetical protein